MESLGIYKGKCIPSRARHHRERDLDATRHTTMNRSCPSRHAAACASPPAPNRCRTPAGPSRVCASPLRGNPPLSDRTASLSKLLVNLLAIQQYRLLLFSRLLRRLLGFGLALGSELLLLPLFLFLLRQLLIGFRLPQVCRRLVARALQCGEIDGSWLCSNFILKLLLLFLSSLSSSSSSSPMPAYSSESITKRRSVKMARGRLGARADAPALHRVHKLRSMRRFLATPPRRGLRTAVQLTVTPDW